MNAYHHEREFHDPEHGRLRAVRIGRHTYFSIDDCTRITSIRRDTFIFAACIKESRIYWQYAEGCIDAEIVFQLLPSRQTRFSSLRFLICSALTSGPGQEYGWRQLPEVGPHLRRLMAKVITALATIASDLGADDSPLVPSPALEQETGSQSR